MKMWKRLAAAVLAAVLTMAMLTACGGDAPVVRDKETETKVVGWIQEYMSSKGYTVTKDAKLDPVVDVAMPGTVKSWNAYDNGNTSEANKQAAQMKMAVQKQFSTTGKKAFYYMTRRGSSSITQADVNAIMNSQIDSIVNGLKSYGVSAPKSIAVGVTTQANVTYIFIIVSD